MEEILADSDEDFDGTDDEESVKTHKRKTKKKTWIQESEDNIVDFIDPGAAKNISGKLFTISIIFIIYSFVYNTLFYFSNKTN